MHYGYGGVNKLSPSKIGMLVWTDGLFWDSLLKQTSLLLFGFYIGSFSKVHNGLTVWKCCSAVLMSKLMSPIDLSSAGPWTVDMDTPLPCSLWTADRGCGWGRHQVTSLHQYHCIAPPVFSEIICIHSINTSWMWISSLACVWPPLSAEFKFLYQCKSTFTIFK